MKTVEERIEEFIEDWKRDLDICEHIRRHAYEDPYISERGGLFAAYHRGFSRDVQQKMNEELYYELQGRRRKEDADYNGNNRKDPEEALRGFIAYVQDAQGYRGRESRNAEVACDDVLHHLSRWFPEYITDYSSEAK